MLITPHTAAFERPAPFCRRLLCLRRRIAVSLFGLLVAGLLVGCGDDSSSLDSTGLDATAPCGVEAHPCCAAMVPCLRDLACVEGVCRRPPRCTFAGIADPAIVTADFPFNTAPDCTDVPAELRDAGTPGTYSANSPGVGRVDCVGLAPGVARIAFAADVRLMHPGRNSPHNCGCNGAWTVGLDLVVEGGATQTLAPDRVQVPADNSCRAGPHFAFEGPAPVDATGSLSVRVDLRDCTRTEPTTCLFVRGTTLSVAQ